MKRVISFTLFGPDPIYAQGAVANADLAAQCYPGWVCRFHVGDSVDRDTVLALVTKPNTEVVLHIGEPEDWTALFWRFDFTGDVVIFRDCDSRLNAREAQAVAEWLASGAEFHVMRDHPAHVMPVMAGMWGGRAEGLAKLPVRDPLTLPCQVDEEKFADQIWLRDAGYPVMRESLLVHADAGMGFDGEDIRGFPGSRRAALRGHEFVGQGFKADGAPRLPQEAYRVSAEPQHEWRLFPEGTVPEWTTPEWYEGRETAPHLEQVGHRDRLMFTAAQVARESMASGFKSVVDLGAGDGGLLSLLGPAMKAWGYDLQPSNVAAAKNRHVDVRLANVLEDDVDWGDIAVCTEMLEHLIDPHGFVRLIAEHAKVLVCSSPRLETANEHYEFHTWAWDGIGYRDLVEQGGWAVKRQNAVHGFQIIVAVKA